jgi:isopentenyldiphosphate isomerase
MWVAKRSMSKQTNPGLLDNIVGGGLPHGLSPRENMIKECTEEAAIPHDLASSAQAVGVIAFHLNAERGIVPETDYVFDLELPDTFQPIPADGEVEAFFLWSMDEVCDGLI